MEYDLGIGSFRCDWSLLFTHKYTHTKGTGNTTQYAHTRENELYGLDPPLHCSFILGPAAAAHEPHG